MYIEGKLRDLQNKQYVQCYTKLKYAIEYKMFKREWNIGV